MSECTSSVFQSGALRKRWGPPLKKWGLSLEHYGDPRGAARTQQGSRQAKSFGTSSVLVACCHWGFKVRVHVQKFNAFTVFLGLSVASSERYLHMLTTETLPFFCFWEIVPSSAWGTQLPNYTCWHLLVSDHV